MLPLEDIQSLLDKLSYRDILIAHHNHLQEQLSLLQNSISNTNSLIPMIDLEGSLSWERVSHLVQVSRTGTKKWMDYFQEDERVFLKQMLPNLSSNDPMTEKYVSLLRRMEWCIKHGIQPESEEGIQIAVELMEISNETFGGDEDLMNKFWEVRKKPAEETGLYPVSEEVLLFVQRSMEMVESSNRNIKEGQYNTSRLSGLFA